jgi:hypothetical protein
LQRIERRWPGVDDTRRRRWWADDDVLVAGGTDDDTRAREEGDTPHAIRVDTVER